MNEKLLQSLRQPMLTIGYADHNSHQPMPRAATVILDGSNTVVMGEAADAIESLTAENERLRAALDFVRTDPCFSALGTVTHDTVTDALGLTNILGPLEDSGCQQSTLQEK
jgi:hypothetical protein